MTSTFDFSQEEAWAANTFLGVGNHLCTIKDPKTTTSRNNHPQVELRVVNNIGDSSRDWITITAASMGHLLQLAEAAGVDNPGSIDIPSEEWDAYVAGFEGKKVGVIVREERKGYGDEPAKLVNKIQAYVKPDELAGVGVTGEVPADTTGLGSSVQDDDIPF